jgi:hypothetical protein
MLIDISEIDKAIVLDKLYEYANLPENWTTILSYVSNPIMSPSVAREILEGGKEIYQQKTWIDKILFRKLEPKFTQPQKVFGYLYGRPLRVDLSSSIIDVTMYDHTNGDGLAWRKLEPLGAKLVPEL